MRCRNVVVLNGKKAIQEALVTRSFDFADRPDSYVYSLATKPDSGYYSPVILCSQYKENIWQYDEAI